MTLPGTASGSSFRTVPSNWDPKRPEEIPWELDDRVHGRRLHSGEKERGGESMAGSGERHG